MPQANLTRGNSIIDAHIEYLSQETCSYLMTGYNLPVIKTNNIELDIKDYNLRNEIRLREERTKLLDNLIKI